MTVSNSIILNIKIFLQKQNQNLISTQHKPLPALNGPGQLNFHQVAGPVWTFDPEVLFLNPDIHLIDLETSDFYKKKSAVKGDKVYNADIDVLGICSKRSIHIMKDILATVYEDYTAGTPYEPAYPSMYQK